MIIFNPAPVYQNPESDIEEGVASREPLLHPWEKGERTPRSVMIPSEEGNDDSEK